MGQDVAQPTYRASAASPGASARFVVLVQHPFVIPLSLLALKVQKNKRPIAATHNYILALDHVKQVTADFTIQLAAGQKLAHIRRHRVLPVHQPAAG